MLILPAIDIRGGRCVRLVEGKFDRETVYAEDPSEMAARFSLAGAKFLHVVDLDGALAGESRNLETIKKIVSRAKGMQVELGGGIRSLEGAKRAFDAGVSRVILGSLAVKDPKAAEAICRAFPGRVAAGIDARDGRVAVDGWEKDGGEDFVELGKKMVSIGIGHIIFTDISRDGRLEGVNAEATARLAKETGAAVIASGGVASLEDVKRLKEFEKSGIEGCIIGKAIYAGRVDLREALSLARA